MRELADELQRLVLEAEPFMATALGVPGYGDRVPDVSAEADARHRSSVVAVRERALQVDPAALSAEDRTTLTCVLAHCDSRLAIVDVAAVEHTVFAASGFGGLVALSAQTVLTTEQSAADHLVRTAGYAGLLDQLGARLEEGAARGRTPVAALVQVVLAQLDGYLDGDGEDPLTAIAPPAGWDGADAWRAELADVVQQQVRPAVRRLRDVVASLPARDDEHCGLVHLPGGADDYARLVLRHTTLDLTPQEVHDSGLAAVAELQQRMVELGARLGLDGYDAVLEALRASSRDIDAEAAMDAAREAVARAEAVAPQWFSPPAPPPCQVRPMSPHLATAGMPPHYTAPTADGARAGTYWFAPLPGGIGSGWDSEAVAFHEAVPGHHLQLSRLLTLRGRLPDLQTQGFVTAHLEGWGLYTEVLAEEMGLYSSDEQRLGALAMQMVRAARLVVDTGLHALGWSRQHALEVFGSLAPVSDGFVTSEVNRYVGMPGQALAYLVGQREVLRLRAEATAALGERFDLRAFHDVVLDHGVLPLPALATAVETWVAQAAS